MNLSGDLESQLFKPNITDKTLTNLSESTLNFLLDEKQNTNWSGNGSNPTETFNVKNNNSELHDNVTTNNDNVVGKRNGHDSLTPTIGVQHVPKEQDKSISVIEINDSLLDDDVVLISSEGNFIFIFVYYQVFRLCVWYTRMYL